MSLPGAKNFKPFVLFIVILAVHRRTMGAGINYGAIRHDEQPLGVGPERVRTTRQILEMRDDRAFHGPTYTLQQATERILRYGALLRIQILDTFGALVYDHYDDFSVGQTEALYRVYQETLERKYNIFDIVPSVLANADTRPTKICRHIRRHVRTCLRESSALCETIRRHDHPHPLAPLTPARVNATRRIYRGARMRENFPDGFSLPAILKHLKAGTLRLTVGLLSGLLHNVRYDSFDDEVRTAERNAMTILTSEMSGAVAEEGLLRRVHTVGELLRELFERRKNMYDRERNKHFAVLAEHVVPEVGAISRNIELLGTVYENGTIDVNYLMNLVLPADVVDADVTAAKEYLLGKVRDYDIVRKHLRVEKYQQSGPDQLLMEILGQMRDIGFAVDLATALHAHARFWQQSRMIRDLDELLELFDAYENLRNVPQHESLVSLMDGIRTSLRDSKNVTVEILCNNPRACLRLGLETVALCALIDSETRGRIERLSLYLTRSGSIYGVECAPPIVRADARTTRYPATFTEDLVADPSTRKRLVTAELSTVETTVTKYVPSATPTTIEDKTTSTTTTETPTESLGTDRTTATSASETMMGTETTANRRTTGSIVQLESTAPLTTESSTESRWNTTDEQSSSRPTTEQSATTTTTTTFATREATTTAQTTTAEEGTTTTEGSAAESTTPAATNNDDDHDDDDDCYEEKCTSETFNESTDTLPSGAWNTDRTRPPPTLSEDLRTTALPVTSTATATTAVDSVTSVTTTEAVPASSDKSTTAVKNPGFSKKFMAYSASSSVEDYCSGGGCDSNDCSGDGCPPRSSAGRSDCIAGDDNCPPGKSNTGEKTAADCSGEGCSSRAMTQQDGDCVGDGCTGAPPTSTSPPNCADDDDCRELSTSDESTCTGEECLDRGTVRPSTTTRRTESPLAAAVRPAVPCDNRDPHHRRKLRRLARIRVINALHATSPAPTVLSADSVADDDSTNESSYSGPSTKHPIPSGPGSPPWPNLPVPRPPRKAVGGETEQRWTVRGGSTDTMNTNGSANVNFINLRRRVAAGTPVPRMSRGVSPPDTGYRRVVTRMTRGPGSRPQPRREIGPVSPGPAAVPSQRNPVAYRRSRPDDDMERVRKNRSIIRAPRRASQRYRAL